MTSCYLVDLETCRYTGCEASSELMLMHTDDNGPHLKPMDRGGNCYPHAQFGLLVAEGMEPKEAWVAVRGDPL